MSTNEIVRFSHVSKQYPGTLANDDVSLTIEKGEVFALVGENGAGKSTLMNLLFGMQKPTLGDIFIKGQKIGAQHNPESAMQMGVSMVHQHFKLVPGFTVAQNILLGHEPKKGLFYDEAAAIENVQAEDLSPLEHFCAFYQAQNHQQPLDERRAQAMQRILEEAEAKRYAPTES